MKNLINKLKEENLACVIKQGEEVYTETDRGVAPIVKHYQAGHLKDALIVDKVIGRASAFFMTAGEPEAVHGMVISKPAEQVFKDNNIKYTYGEIVENIINRDGTDLCPMEKSVLAEDDIQKGMEIILCKIKK